MTVAPTEPVPRSGPILGSDGNFYGTTYYGGASNKGSIYRITPKGSLTMLHSFVGADGNYPINEMVQATNGVFYGTTTAGGSKSMGTIFSLAAGLNPFVETLPIKVFVHVLHQRAENNCTSPITISAVCIHPSESLPQWKRG